MAGCRSETWIPSTPDEVFRFCLVLSNAPKIVPGVISQEVLTEGPTGVGTRLRETREIRGKLGNTELEIIEYAPPDQYR